MSKQTVLVTGGAGYIGSHTVLELLNRDYDVIVLDNLSNSSEESLARVAELTGRRCTFVKGDICQIADLTSLFEEYRFDAVIHFAGLKAVGESNEMPLAYYENNVSGTVNLLNVMKQYDVKSIVFSSSATVYGPNNPSPLDETMPTSAINPYGRTKLMIEEILVDLAKSDPNWNIIALRYFNPIGAHDSGRIGEDPNGIPNNLIPYVAQVAVGKLPHLNVFGNDYDTHDGTGVRDYIHVVDLAIGHVKALDKLSATEGFCAINLGTGNGTSVLEIVKGFENTADRPVPYEIQPRREGDLGTVFADASLAKSLLGWEAERDITNMIETSWRWQSNNPDGYSQ